ncbi:MAG TPA: CoA pyrophosphatase [Bacteroidia bacterium]|nr:CoA pyrophosphatase [Bacteroidia bacterium]
MMNIDLFELAIKIKSQAQIKLPGIESHKVMLPEGRSMPNDYLDKIENYKQSAVFALLFNEHNNINLLLTQRHQYIGKHSGQISFPGGKKESEDETLLTTAYRETYEEIGVKKNDIHFITHLSPLYIPVSNFLVQPFLGYLNNLPELLLNEREVKNIVKFPLNQINDPTIIKQINIEASSGLHLTVPAFEINGNIIWGATAMMLKEIGDLIKNFED